MDSLRRYFGKTPLESLKGKGVEMRCTRLEVGGLPLNGEVTGLKGTLRGCYFYKAASVAYLFCSAGKVFGTFLILKEILPFLKLKEFKPP